MTSKPSDAPKAKQEEQKRDDLLRRLLKTPPQQRPKREDRDKPAKRKGGDKIGRAGG